MAIAKAKTINLLLYEGDLSGVISIEDSSWNSGELYSAPRASVDELLQTDAVKKYGVYLLISSEMVYVGQASDLSRRITQHTVGKDWWESVVILTTKDDSLNHSDIDYLETVLIEKAQSNNRLDCDNKKKGNNPKVDKFRQVYLGQYLEEALFLMQLIGINVFSAKSAKTNTKGTGLINTVDTSTKLALGRRAKSDAISFLKEKGIEVGKSASYAAKQSGNGEYWINPQQSLLTKDWDIILNDIVAMELILVRIPANTYIVSAGKENGFKVRADRGLLDININGDTLVDRKSGIDFSKHIIKKTKY